MPSERTKLIPETSADQDPEVGEYRPARSTDSRSPCPVLNALANHGYLPRDGRNLTVSDFMSGITHVGVSYPLRTALARPIYAEYIDPNTKYQRLHESTSSKLWYYLQNPWAAILPGFALWNGKQRRHGNRAIDLEGLAVHGPIENDISMTRRDVAQPQGANALQVDLVENLLALANDEGYITMEHMVKFRLMRIEQQREDNSDLYYGAFEHTAACTNIVFIMNAFGDGQRIPVDQLRALLLEERLPLKEGWQRRWWWPLGLVESKIAAKKVEDLVGLKF